MLLTIPDYELWAGREVAEREGAPIVAVDLGGGRAWSAATAFYISGARGVSSGRPWDS